MIYPQSFVQILDNSGIKTVKCIHVENKNYGSFSKVGRSFIGVILKINNSSSQRRFFKKGSLVRCLLTCSQKEIKNSKAGIYLKSYNKNGAILIHQKSKSQHFEPLFSRYLGFLSFSFKNQNFSQVCVVSKFFI